MDSHRKGPACRHDRPSRKFNSKFTIMCKLKGNPTEERVLMVRWKAPTARFRRRPQRVSHGI